MPTDFLSEATGLSASKLGQATATEGDVLVGKTFYSGDKTLKTGTMKDTQSLAVTPMVLTHACMSLNQASLPSGDCNPNFITSSSWGNSFTYTFQRAGNYRVYARSSVSWAGSWLCRNIPARAAVKINLFISSICDRKVKYSEKPGAEQKNLSSVHPSAGFHTNKLVLYA